MRTYEVTLTGKMPLIMHNDDIEWADRMEAWKNNPENKKRSKAGDDRTPPFRWLGSLYHWNGSIAMPTDNVMRSMMGGGAMVPTGQRQGTFKSQTQSGMVCPDITWSLFVRGNQIPTAQFFEKMESKTFDQYQDLAAKHGFVLFVKRARIGAMKHIRVRPRFDDWRVVGSVIVTDESITDQVLTQILHYAGTYKGLGDWRPGGKTPGPYGMFTAEIKRTE